MRGTPPRVQRRRWLLRQPNQRVRHRQVFVNQIIRHVLHAVTVLRREPWDGYDVGRFERGGKDTEQRLRIRPAEHRWLIFLHANLTMALVAVLYLSTSHRGAEGGQPQRETKTPWKMDGCEKHPRKWCSQSTHRPRVEVLSADVWAGGVLQMQTKTYSDTCTVETCSVHWTRCVVHMTDVC